MCGFIGTNQIRNIHIPVLLCFALDVRHNNNKQMKLLGIPIRICMCYKYIKEPLPACTCLFWTLSGCT